MQSDCLFLGAIGATAMVCGYVSINRSVSSKTGKPNWQSPVLATGVILLLVGFAIAAHVSAGLMGAGNDRTIMFCALGVLAIASLMAANSGSGSMGTSPPGSQKTDDTEQNLTGIVIAGAIMIASWLSSKSIQDPTMRAAGPIAGIAILIAIGHVLPRAREHKTGVDSIGYPLLTAALFTLVYLQCQQGGDRHIEIPEWIHALRARISDVANKTASTISSPFRRRVAAAGGPAGPLGFMPNYTPTPTLTPTSLVDASYRVPGVAQGVAAQQAALSSVL